jgi:AcrR family transcriptional regulator
MIACDNRRRMVERGKYDRGVTPAVRKKEQRRALLLAATSVFARLGYAGAKVEDVVEEAGISRRTFYEHFDDLAGALAAVHDASGKFAMRLVDAELAQAPPKEKLERGIRALLTLVSQNPGLARVLFGETRVAGRRFEERQEKLRAHFALVLREALVGLGKKPDDVAVVALVAGIEAVGLRVAHDASTSLDDATAALVRLAKAA